ncbi:N-acetyltransferase family protein [Paraburkholderia sp. 2C]
MHIYMFKDRSARAITIEFDERRGRAVARHRDQPVGWVHFEPATSTPGGARATLVDLFVEPAYRRSGIAHTLLAHLSQEMDGPIEVDVASSTGGTRGTRGTRGAQGAEFSALCSHLACEGLIVSGSS